MAKAQEAVSGTVDLRLHKANILNRGRSSHVSLYNQVCQRRASSPSSGASQISVWTPGSSADEAR